MDYIKINDSENAIFDENGNLQIDGASYVEGLDDYEWFFLESHWIFLVSHQLLLSGNEEWE